MVDATTEVVGIGEFRQRATELIRQVEESAQPLRIARRGTPVVEIRSLATSPSDLEGSVTFVEDIDLWKPVVAPDEWSSNK